MCYLFILTRSCHIDSARYTCTISFSLPKELSRVAIDAGLVTRICRFWMDAIGNRSKGIVGESRFWMDAIGNRSKGIVGESSAHTHHITHTPESAHAIITIIITVLAICTIITVLTINHPHIINNIHDPRILTLTVVTILLVLKSLTCPTIVAASQIITVRPAKYVRQTLQKQCSNEHNIKCNIPTIMIKQITY